MKTQTPRRPTNTRADQQWPYMQLLTADLERLANEKWESAQELHLLYSELVFRSKRKAVLLRSRIEVKLRDMTSYFPWPTTDVAEGGSRGGQVVFTVEQGMLGFMGYRVGANGIASEKRKALLDYIFENALPKLESEEYMRGWGNPRSSTRLKKLANTLAFRVRLAKRNDRERYQVAISEWTADLRYLKKRHYGDFRFTWPDLGD
jgi:hypothetical protein